METTPAPFDLNLAIQQWRDDLAKSPAIRTESLEELEMHLRDSVARLQARELSAEEAFLIAAKRMGSTARLGAEFDKVNSQSAWLDRVFWAVIIMQAWSFFERLCAECTILVQNAVQNAMLPPGAFRAPSQNGWLNAGIYLANTVIPLTLAVFLAWYLLKSPQSRGRLFLETFSRRPLSLAIIFFCASVTVQYLFLISIIFGNQGIVHIPVRAYFQALPSQLLYAGMIFVLAKKRLLRKA